jgi:hypothetical protein
MADDAVRHISPEGLAAGGGAPRARDGGPPGDRRADPHRARVGDLKENAGYYGEAGPGASRDADPAPRELRDTAVQVEPVASPGYSGGQLAHQ